MVGPFRQDRIIGRLLRSLRPPPRSTPTAPSVSPAPAGPEVVVRISEALFGAVRAHVEQFTEDSE